LGKPPCRRLGGAIVAVAFPEVGIGVFIACIHEMTALKLRCQCGSVQGSVDFSRPSRVHVICHCDDCGAYARHIGNAGATEIVQATPDQVMILAGKEHLRCLRLTESGLTRWFTGCCMTPVANTSRRAWMPFVGLMIGVLDTRHDVLLGPATHANGTYPTPWATVLRSIWAVVLGVLHRRHRPNAFFNESGRPVAEPEVLS
jgi:hypothetical protein